MSATDMRGNSGNRGSKQKIMQLRQELNSGSGSVVTLQAKNEKVQILRESYEIARNRSNELHHPNNDTANVYLKVHEQRASKVYSALSSLIFASICSSKVEELEEFVKKTASNIPSSIFDMDEWNRIIDIARECRGMGLLTLQQDADSLRRSLRLTHSIAAQPLSNIRSEIQILKRSVSNELRAAQSDILNAMNVIMYLTNELKDRTNSDRNVQRIEKMAAETKDSREQLEEAQKLHQQQLELNEKSHAEKQQQQQQLHDAAVASLTAQLQQTSAALAIETSVRSNLQQQLDEYSSQRESELQTSKDSNTALNTELIELKQQLATSKIQELQLQQTLHEERLSSAAERATVSSVDSAQFHVLLSVQQKRSAEELRVKNEQLLLNIETAASEKSLFVKQLQDADAKLAEVQTALQEKEKQFADQQQQVSLLMQQLSTAEKCAVESSALSQQQTKAHDAESNNKLQQLERELAAVNAALAAANSALAAATSAATATVAAPGLIDFLNKLSIALLEHQKHAQQLGEAVIATNAAAENSSAATSALTADVPAVANSANDVSSSNNNNNSSRDQRPQSPAGGVVDKFISEGTDSALRRLSPNIYEQQQRQKQQLQQSAIIATTTPVNVTAIATVGIDPQLSAQSCVDIEALLQQVEEFKDSIRVAAQSSSEESAAAASALLALHAKEKADLSAAVESTNQQLIAERLTLQALQMEVKAKNDDILQLQDSIKQLQETATIAATAPTTAANVAVVDSAVEDQSKAASSVLATEAVMLQLADLEQQLAESSARLKDSEAKVAALQKELNHKENGTTATAALITAAGATGAVAAATAVAGASPEKVGAVSGKLAQVELKFSENAALLKTSEETVAALQEAAQKLEADLKEKKREIEALKAATANATATPAADAADTAAVIATNGATAAAADDNAAAVVAPGAISDLSDYEQSEDTVVALQSHMRSYLARAKVRKIKQEKAATEQGLLVASHGTKQGETGWYKTNDQLYFFCMDQGEYILLCGPISDDIYNLACEEIGMDPKLLKSAQKNHMLELNRLGLQATRIQIETLFEDLRSRDSVIGEQTAQLETQKQQLQELQQTLLRLESERVKLRMEHIAASIEQEKEDVTPEMEQAFNKLSSAMRGYLGRNRVKKIRNFKEAKETGQLIPLKNTKQGDTGWYAAPDGGIYYFILKEGQWIHTVGPLSEEEYEANRVAAKAKQRSHAEGVLTRCNFTVSPMHQLQLQLLHCSGTDNDNNNNSGGGELFLASHTEKLFVAVPVQYVLKQYDEEVEEEAAKDAEQAVTATAATTSAAETADIESITPATLTTAAANDSGEAAKTAAVTPSALDTTTAATAAAAAAISATAEPPLEEPKTDAVDVVAGSSKVAATEAISTAAATSSDDAVSASTVAATTTEKTAEQASTAATDAVTDAVTDVATNVATAGAVTEAVTEGEEASELSAITAKVADASVKAATASGARGKAPPLMSQTSQASLSRTGTMPSLQSPQVSPSKRPQELAAEQPPLKLAQDPSQQLAINPKLLQ